jgi:outer membrane protein insertion porin family
VNRLLLVFILVLVGSNIEAATVNKALLRWARNRPISSIQIDGNKYFSEGHIRKRLYSRTRNVWLAIKGDRRSRVQAETLQRDTLEVKYLYLTSGFLDARITHTYEPRLPDSSAVVMIHIEEGPQYIVGSTALEGSFNPTFHRRLFEMVSKMEPGKPVNLFQLKDTEAAMKAYLANRGYPYARIVYAIDSTTPPEKSRIAFTVAADSLVHFGNVLVEVANLRSDSVKRYPEYVARRELKIAPGALYRRDDILESQRRLFESGYFTTFQLGRAETSQDSLNPDFRLRVTERKSAYTTLRVGAARSEVRDLVWDISAGAGQRNVWGSRTIEGSVDLSFAAGKDTRLLENLITASFKEPWFLGTRTNLTLSAEYQPRIKDAVKDFDKESWVLSAAFSRWFGRKLKINSGLEYQKIRLSNIAASEIPIIKKQEGISERRKIYFASRRDARDDLFMPQKGSVTELNGDLFGGFLRGDADFFKILASWSRYRRVWPGWISASRLRGAWAEAYSNTATVPADEALYLGGANTIRGVAENHLGPLDINGNPIGARYTMVFNQEFRWKTIQVLTVLPLIGDLMTQFPLWQSLFVDVGNGFRNEREIRLQNMAVAYGFGFQIVSPAGPIRIDYGELLKHDDFQYSHRWHFTILYAF